MSDLFKANLSGKTKEVINAIGLAIKADQKNIFEGIGETPQHDLVLTALIMAMHESDKNFVALPKNEIIRYGLSQTFEDLNERLFFLAITLDGKTPDDKTIAYVVKPQLIDLLYEKGWGNPKTAQAQEKKNAPRKTAKRPTETTGSKRVTQTKKNMAG